MLFSELLVTTGIPWPAFASHQSVLLSSCGNLPVSMSRLPSSYKTPVLWDSGTTYFSVTSS